jgi:RNA polymerase sigma factor (sigma-70 family)
VAADPTARTGSPIETSDWVAANDATLVAACIDGDQLAWRELVRRYGRLVYSIAHECGLGEDDSRDVFQTVFAALVDQLPRLRDRQSVAKWLITTTHRTAWRRSRRNDVTAPLDGVPDHDERPPPELIAQLERQQLVRMAMERMDERCRSLLEALYVQQGGSSYADVSRRLNMPVGSIGPTHARCLRKLLELVRTMDLTDAGDR